jgi:hypothetical protein
VAATSPNEAIVAGIAGLIAGATAMAAGEYAALSGTPYKPFVVVAA